MSFRWGVGKTAVLFVLTFMQADNIIPKSSKLNYLVLKGKAEMERKNSVTTFRSFIEAYEHFCKPLCRELAMPQMAFDILMFLSNNPEFCTAREISRHRGFKENILSVNISKLVCEGYLERLPVEGDRRKVRLVCTPKAQPIIERGRRQQDKFNRMIREGLTEEELVIFRHCLEVVGRNARRIQQMDMELSENV